MTKCDFMIFFEFFSETGCLKVITEKHIRKNGKIRIGGVKN